MDQLEKMLDLGTLGTVMDAAPFEGIGPEVFHLTFFQGPLSTVRRAAGKWWVWHWCDEQQGLARWFVREVTAEEVLCHVAGETTLRQFLESGPEAFLVDVDLTSEPVKTVLWRRLDAPVEFPEAYRPDGDVRFSSVDACWPA